MRTPDQDLICTFLTIQGAEECPLLANNGSLRDAAGTSALPPATDIQNGDVCFAPDYFRSTPRSRHFLRLSETSEVDPKRKFAVPPFLEGMQFFWQWNGGMIYTVLDVIWGMSE